MAIKVTYSDGRTVVSDRGKTTEFNARGKKIIRLVKTTTSTGGTRFSKPENVQLKGFSKNDTQNILPFITAAQREAANKNAAARLVIESLAASRQRQNIKRSNTIAIMTLTPSGRRNLQVLSSGQASAFLDKNRNAPFSNTFKNKIRQFIEQNRPAGRKGNRFRFEIIILGEVHGTNSKREAKFLVALKKTIERDQAFKRDIHDAMKRRKLIIKPGDRPFTKAVKGAGVAFLIFLKSPRVIGNLLDKAVITTAGLLTPNSRREVLREAGRAAKATPKAVGEGLDPRKPENWFNILLVLASVNLLAVNALKTGKFASITTTQRKVIANLKKASIIKRLALKSPKKNASILRRLAKQEKLLLAKKKALAKRLKELKKSKTPKVKIKVKKKSLKGLKARRKALVKKKAAFLKELRKQALRREQVLKRARKAGFSDKQARAITKKYIRGLKKRKSSLLRSRKKFVKEASLESKALANRLAKAKKSGLNKKQISRLKRKLVKALKNKKKSLVKDKKEFIRLVKKKNAEGQRLLKRLRENEVTIRQISKGRRIKLLKAKRASLLKQRANIIKQGRLKVSQALKLLESARKAGISDKQLLRLKIKLLKARKAFLKGEIKKTLVSSKILRKLESKKFKAQARQVTKLRRQAKRIGPKLIKRGARISRLQSQIEALLSQIEKLSPAAKAKVRILRATPRASPKVVEVRASNGQIVLLKTPETIAKTAGKSVNAPPRVVKGALAYYTTVFSQAKVGKPFKTSNSRAVALHKTYFPMFKSGTTHKLGTSPFSAVGRVSRLSPKSKARSKTSSAVDRLSRQAISIATRIATLQAQRVTPRFLQELLRKLDTIRIRLKKLKRRFKFPRPKKKRRLSKKQKDEWDKLFSKLKRKYRPSLAAILFGIYGYRPKKVTGFEIRPLRKRRKKVVRKRKKRT